MKTFKCNFFFMALLLCLGLALGAAPILRADEPKEKAGKVSLLAQVPQLTPFSDYQGSDWRNATTAFGFGEIGASRQALYEKGIAIDLGMTNVTQGVVSGGVDTTWENTNITDQQIAFDSGRLNWWPGGLVVVHGRSKIGNDVNAEAGTISPVNNAALTPDSSENDKWFLEEYYILQALSEKWSVVGGRLIFSGIGDLNRFAGNEKTQFLNTSLRNSPLLGIISQATSLHGAAVNYSPNPDVTISPFVLSNNDVDAKWGSPGGLFSEYSAGLQLQASWEIAGLKGYISPLFGYTSVDAKDFSGTSIIVDAIQGLPIPEKDDNWVVGFTFDHYLYMPKASKTAATHSAQFDKEPEGIGVFARFHYAPEDRNPWNIFASGGVGGRGVIPGRPNDRYGLGFYAMFESNDLKDQPALGDVLDTEWGIEAFYNIAFTPWLQLTPSVQYIQPGVKDIDQATLLAVRLQVDF